MDGSIRRRTLDPPHQSDEVSSRNGGPSYFPSPTSPRTKPFIFSRATLRRRKALSTNNRLYILFVAVALCSIFVHWGARQIAGLEGERDSDVLTVGNVLNSSIHNRLDLKMHRERKMHNVDKSKATEDYSAVDSLLNTNQGDGNVVRFDESSTKTRAKSIKSGHHAESLNTTSLKASGELTATMYNKNNRSSDGKVTNDVTIEAEYSLNDTSPSLDITRSLSANTTNANLIKDITPIRHIFSYGLPRTASTTQFNILCAALFLHTRKHSPELLNNTICTIAGSFSNDEEAYKFTIQQHNIPQVIKSHVAEPDPRQIKNSTYVFTTVRDKREANQTMSMLRLKGLNVGIVQDLETLKTHGIQHWLKLYGKFFSLTLEEVNLMSEYFQLWDKLRQCCGMQMSKNHRNDLLPEREKDSSIGAHPFCSTLDPNRLELDFMETELFKLIRQYPLMRRINRPATVDGDLDGEYCSRYTTSVQRNGIPPEARKYAGLNSMYSGLENHWHEELNDPFLGSHDLVHDDVCNGEQYIFFTAVNGFSNQLRGIERAMRIAYSTNRTLIMPPLLPHHTAKPYGGFRGRDLFTVSHEIKFFMLPVNISLTDIAKVTSLSNRTDLPAFNFDDIVNKTELRARGITFPYEDKSDYNGNGRTSWSEVLSFGEITNRTGVKLIDLYDFVDSKSKGCIYEVLRQPSPPVPIITQTNKSTTWADFIDRFNEQYRSYPIALIGNAFVLGVRTPIFTSHDILMARYEPITKQRIHEGVCNLALSTKVTELLKIALARLPSNYISVHLRTGDESYRKIQTCTDKAIMKEYYKVEKTMRQTNITRGHTIYIASNDGKAKECFDEFTNNMYKVMNIDDVMRIDDASGGSIAKIMDGMSIEPSSKYLLLDILLVSHGAQVYFAMMNFELGHHFSTFQALIAESTNGVVRDCTASENIHPDTCNLI